MTADNQPVDQPHPDVSFRCCPACGSLLAPPATPAEDPADPAFELPAPRCSGSGVPWVVCPRPPDTTMAPRDDATGHTAAFLHTLAGKVHAGEAGAVDAALVLTVDSISVPPRVGTAVHRLDAAGQLWVIENMAKVLRANERHSPGGIILAR